MLVDFLKCKISWRAHRPWFPNLKFVDSTNHSTLFLLPSVHLRWAQVQRNWQRFGMLLISWVFTKNWFWEVFLSLCSNVLYVIMLVVNVVPPERLKVIDLWWGMVAEIYTGAKFKTWLDVVDMAGRSPLGRRSHGLWVFEPVLYTCQANEMFSTRCCMVRANWKTRPSFYISSFLELDL